MYVRRGVGQIARLHHLQRSGTGEGLLIPVSNSEVSVAGGGVEQDDGNGPGTCRIGRSVERGLNMSDFRTSAQRQHVPILTDPLGSPEP